MVGRGKVIFMVEHRILAARPARSYTNAKVQLLREVEKYLKELDFDRLAKE